MTAKKFLLLYFGVATVVWIAGTVLMGPPGLSRAYLDAENNKADHDRYLTIIKSKPYQLYEQRPAFHGPVSETAPEDFQAQIDFVIEYKSRPAFQAETRRMKNYYHFFEVFNFLLVIWLIVHFGRKPLLNFLDGKISELRDTLDSAEAERTAAESRKAEAETKLAGLPEEEKALEAQTEQELARQLAELEEANQHSLTLMRQELEDRKNEEVRLAALLVKQELIEEAVTKMTDDFKAGQSPALQAALVDQFVAEMEKRA